MTLQPTDLSRLNETDRRRVRRYRSRIQGMEGYLLGLAHDPAAHVRFPVDLSVSQIYVETSKTYVVYTLIFHSMSFEPVPEGTEPPELWPQPTFDEPTATHEPMRDANPTAAQDFYKFTIVLSGIDQLTQAVADALYETGCADATLSSVGSVVSLDFDRFAASLAKAIGSAVDEVGRAGFQINRITIG
jgi:hypothetical protein